MAKERPAELTRATFLRIQVTDFRIHDLKHTCASWMLRQGVSLSVVRDILGHSTIRMTERYAHVAADHLHEGVALLERKSRLSHVKGGVSKMHQ